MKKQIFKGLASLLLPMGAYAGISPAASYQPYQRSYLRSGPSVGMTLDTARISLNGDNSSTLVEEHEELMLAHGQPVRELMVIDTAVPDKHIFYREAKPGVDIVEIDSSQPGLSQLVEALGRYKNLSALHIVSHAEDGVLLLGNSRITAENIKYEIEAFAALNGAMREGGDLLLYGCDLAAGEKGAELLDIVQRNTHLDVAASNDLTGNAAQAGDWDLEIQRGNIETTLAFSEKALADFSSVLATYTLSGFDYHAAGATSNCPDDSTTETYNYKSLSQGSYIVCGFVHDNGFNGTTVNVTNYSSFYLSYGDAYLEPIANQTASGTNSIEVRRSSGSFQLTQVVAEEFAGSNTFSSVKVIGYVSGGGTIESTDITSDDGTANTFTFTSGSHLANFAGVNLTKFRLAFVNAGGSHKSYMGLQSFDAIQDTTPPVVQSIALSGSPAATDSSLTYTITFDESASNISTDDFQLTTVSGTATGTVSSVSAASGTSVNVTVNGITGTGSIRLDLNSNTNITDASGNGNNTNGYVAAYSSGDTHTVDRDAPTYQNSTPSVSGTTFTQTTLTVRLSEIGAAFYVVVPDSAGAPSSAQVVAGQDSGGGAASFSGNISVTTAGQDFTTDITGLTMGTAYDLYVVARDDEGTPNLQTAPTLVDFSTQARDSDTTVTAGGTVNESLGLGLNTCCNSSAQSLNIFDFDITDGGTSDGLATSISQIVLNVSGTSTDAERNQVTWRLYGSGANYVTGVYDALLDTITFSGLSISIANGSSENYRISGYISTPAGVTDGSTVILSVDGETGITVGGGGTQMASGQAAVTNGTGLTLDVDANQLVFTTQPAGSVSGSVLTTQPVVTARDNAGNTDLDFTDTITLTEASAGTLSGDIDVAAVNGVATFTDVVYTATADQQSFTLTADDQSGVGSDLPTVDANAVTSDVVATQLLFTTQPSPTSVDSGVNTSFTTVPVVSAVDANNTVDTGYSTDITLQEVNGAGSATMTATADTDGNGATVSITPSSGVSTFTGMQITYTASGGSNETFNLRASSGGLTTTDSNQFTAVVNQPPTDIGLSASSINQSTTGAAAAVGTLSTTDADGGDTHTYSLVTNGASGTGSCGATGDDDNASFQIDNANDELETASTLTPGTYNVCVQTTDGAASYQESFSITVVDNVAPTISSVSVPANATYISGQNLNFTVNTSENVTVNTGGGTPRIALTIGGPTLYADYLSGSGSSALVFRYTVQPGDLDTDGIGVAASLDANSGTLRDSANNDLNTTLNSVGATTSVLVDAVVPSGHSVSFDDATINSTEATSISFTFSSAEVGTDYSYTISSSGGGTPVTGSGTVASAGQQISGLDVSGLGDGTLTLSVTLTDAAGNAASAVTDTASLDTAAPSGHSVSFDDSNINNTEASATSFTFASAEVGAGYSYTISSSGGGTPVTGSGTIASAGQQISGLNVSGLSDGTLTLSVTLTDTAGNAASAVTDTATLDAAAPGGHSVSFDDANINGTEASSTSFTFASAEVGADYSYTISSSGGGTPVTGSGTLASATNQISGIDVSGLADGTLTLSVTLTDTGGNSASAVTDTATLDAAAPSGHSVSFDDGSINGTEATSISFTFASAEVGSDYSFTISSSGGGTPVAGSGTLASATDQISGIDVSGLSDGTLTLSVTLTDTTGNAAGAVTDTATLDTAVPSGHSVSFDDAMINGADAASTNFTFASAEVGAGYSYTISSSGGGTPVTGSGTIASATDQISGINVGSLADGTLTLSVTLTDTAGNAASAVTDTTNLDGTAPTLDSSNPADNATGVQYDADLVLTFSENVVALAGAGAVVELYDSGDNLVTTAIATSGDVSVNNNVVTVDFFPTLWANMAYYVHISGIAFQDAAGNNYAGIADNTTLNFTIGNTAPVANDDADTTDEDTAVLVDVLANDNDVDSNLNAASTAIASAPSNGSTSINTVNGVITYTPAADFNGSDSFTYTVEDVYGAISNAATVTITVNAVNDAPVAVADMATTSEDTLVSIDVAANDTDVDVGDSVDPATIVIVSAASNGSAVVNAGQVDYTPDTDFTGTDNFSYTIDDQNGAVSNTVTVTINVTGVNDLPTAANDSATTNEDEDVDIDVLANDSDLDGTIDGTTVQVMSTPANGSTFVDALTGVITYTPDANYFGSDSFTYVVQDDAGGTSNAATVSLTITSVNDAPVAANDTAIVLEDASIEVNVLGNDSDVDGSLVPASAEVVSAATSGNTSINATTGAITYTPNADFSGSDTFTYRVQDNDGAWSAAATVTMTVNNVNDAPVASDDSATTEEDTAVVINLVTNDTDIDDGLNNASVVIVSTASNGTLTNNGDGTVTYTPDTAYIGSDSFSYTVADNSAAVSNVATVSITVTPGNEAPVISGSPATSAMVGEVYSFTPTASDADTGDTLTFSITGQPGWLSFSTSTGVLSGTPADADEGTTGAIVISVSDGEDTASLAAFSITVAEGTDTDGDTISDYQEGLDQTDPLDPTSYLDLMPPSLMAPAEVVLDASALFTPVHIKQLLGLELGASDTELQAALDELASDNVDGDACCDPDVDNLLPGSILLLPPGRNEVTWMAEDFMGNISEVTQIVNLRPLVSLSKDQTTVEGATVNISVILNGESPFYPFTVPFVVDNTSTANSSDHDLVAGTVTFTETNGVGQTRATVAVNILTDAMSEGEETLVVRLDDRTSNAEDLANGYDPDNPDIYDINSGARTRHTIRIVEGNLAPDVRLQLQQNGMNTVLVAANGGPVTITAQVTDPNPGDTQSYDWSRTDNSLVDTDGNAQNATVVFNPSGLTPGRYAARVEVTDSEGASGKARLFFRVLASLPTLSAEEDTDEDGLDDLSEGTGDGDDDGIPNYLDNIPAENVVPEEARSTRSFLMECDPGVRCRLGQYALLGNSGGTQLDEDDISEQDDLIPDVNYIPVGGIFDFEVRDLPETGQSVQIVIPQRVAIPEEAVYRKFSDGSWHTFVEDANNMLHSTVGNTGYCPPPGDEAWEPGLVTGHLCVQLTIEDGGPNDADGEVNGSVEDPGAVSIYQPPFVSHNVRSTGGGGSASLGLLLALGLMLLAQCTSKQRWQQHLRAITRTRMFSAIAPLLLGGALITQTEVSHAQGVLSQSSIELAVYQTESSQSGSEFVNAMAADGVTVDLQRYDTSRTAWQLAWGYQVHERISLQLGYLDLGDVDVDFAAVAADNATLEAALEQHYPAHASGWTVGYRFEHGLANNLFVALDAGLYLWHGDIEVSGAPISPGNDKGLDLLLGLGANYRLNEHWRIGLKLQRVFFDREDMDLLGAEVGWHF